MTHHSHLCECGTTLECSRADCAVLNPFVCPTCEFQMRDEFFQQAEELDRLHEAANRLLSHTTTRTEPTKH